MSVIKAWVGESIGGGQGTKASLKCSILPLTPIELTGKERVEKPRLLPLSLHCHWLHVPVVAPDETGSGPDCRAGRAALASSVQPQHGPDTGLTLARSPLLLIGHLRAGVLAAISSPA